VLAKRPKRKSPNALETAAAGITPGTVRLSMGLENLQDLLDDLRRARA
jgi:cystathionine beta-lyase/cystathionine gamma-synthase